MTAQLAILVPVLNRPDRVLKVISNVYAATKDVKYRLLFIASENDHQEIKALEREGADYITVPRTRGTWACKINDGFRATTEPWVFTGADDLNFHKDWFTRAMRWAGDEYMVVGTNDICNGRVMMGDHSTHTLFRRDYVEKYGTIDKPGIVMHEAYKHAFTDDEAVSTAKARGVYVHAFDAIVEHLHPMSGKSKEDGTYKLGARYTSDGRKIFHARRHLWEDKEGVMVAMQPPPERAVVVTATYGGYDAQLRVPVEQDMPVDWVVVTDNKSLQVPAPWRVAVDPARFPDDPRMSAKVPKMVPQVGCLDVVWMDASHEIISPSFVREALAARRNGIAAFKHPRRDCIYREIQALLGSENQGGLYFDRPLRQQEQAYRRERYPRRNGLYACGVLAWDLRDEKAKELGHQWLLETEKWSHQDQVEFPVVCRRLGITPGTFPVRQIDQAFSERGQYLGNRWLRIHRHKVVEPA